MSSEHTSAPPDTRESFQADVLYGLNQQQKMVPCRWLYDEAGSVLFDTITRQAEYYPTRTEMGILKDNIQHITAEAGARTVLVEYGAGASSKTRILLNNLEQPAAYVPIDISHTFLLKIATDLRREYPGLAITPVSTDFLDSPDGLDLPVAKHANLVGFFSGSTISNFDDDEIERFLRHVRTVLGDNGRLLLSVDLCRRPEILIPAYNDPAQVTARFNLNLLARINHELDGNFNPDHFSHKAIWNESIPRIEMHLVSNKQQMVNITGKQFSFQAGETIHTENSRKFMLTDLLPIFTKTGWRLYKQWSDPDRLYAVLMLSAQ